MLEEVDCLHLEIHLNSCRCGNKWKSSYPILASEKHGFLGGTPNPQDSYRLPVRSMAESNVPHDHCFQCVELTLGKNWVNNKNLVLLELRRANAAKTEELLA